MRVGIIGSGRVGKALGKALVRDVPVLFYDIIDNQLDPLRQEGYETTTDLAAVESVSDIVFMAVPTESLPNGNCDTSILEEVINRLSADRYRGKVVQVSTCPPGTAREMAKLLRLKNDYIVHPSFYSMARMEYDALHPVHILLGSKDGMPINEITTVFKRFDGPINWCTWEEAELIKYADNCLSSTLITYWNQIAIVAEKLGVEVDRVARIVDRDPQYRSIFRFSGKAYGGFCLPKDTLAFRNFIREAGVDDTLISAVHSFNEKLRKERGENEKHFVYRT